METCGDIQGSQEFCCGIQDWSYSRFHQHVESQNFPHTHSGSVGRNKFNQLNRSIFGILPMIKYGTFHMILLCQASVRYLSELSCSSELTVGHSELKYWAHFLIFCHTVFFT